MKKFVFLLSVVSFLSAYPMDFNTLLNKPKIPTRTIESTAYGFPEEFQINLKENKNTLSTKTTPYGNLGLYDHIPAIGFYTDPYQFAIRLALIELDPRMITQALPQTLKQALINNLAPGKSLQEILGSRTVYAHIMISSFIPDTVKYNLVFHPFAYSFMKKPAFNINIQMGVFNANGIGTTSSGIAFETLRAESVIAHNGIDFAFSPNNARIAITANRSVSTFWSAAYSPDKQFVTITYHIMTNNEKTQNAFEKFISAATNLGNLLNSMATTKDTLDNAVDNNALEDAINTIVAILKWQEQQQIVQLSTTLNQLTIQLKQLQQQLEKILQQG